MKKYLKYVAGAAVCSLMMSSCADSLNVTNPNNFTDEQIMDLLENGVQGIHLYTMNNVEVASRISRNIENIIAAKNAGENHHADTVQP